MAEIKKVLLIGVVLVIAATIILPLALRTSGRDQYLHRTNARLRWFKAALRLALDSSHKHEILESKSFDELFDHHLSGYLGRFDHLKKDAWGEKFVLRIEPNEANIVIKIISKGKDRQLGSRDDLFIETVEKDKISSKE